jgi:hypothetical protein
MEAEQIPIARQRLRKHIPAEENVRKPISKQRIGKHTAIEVFLENVFSVRAASRLYNEDLRQLRDKIN